MDDGALAARFFLDEDGVGAGGERGAGGDAYRLARADAAGEGVPGGALTDQAEGAGKIGVPDRITVHRSEEHTSELQSLMRTSYAVFCLKKKKKKTKEVDKH